jgi:AmmeMemoRadiSam system protein B
LVASPDPAVPGTYILADRIRITQRQVRVRHEEIIHAQFFDGQTSLDHARVISQQKGVATTVEQLAELAARLDAAFLLDSPALQDYLAGPIREPSCVGVYSADPGELRGQLGSLFVESGLPGPKPAEEDGGLRAVLAPHMDYGRGGQVYGHAFKEVFDRSAARVFVIVATSHYSTARFSLTRQSFCTPFGVMPTDVAYVDRIANEYGDGAFGDPLAHFPEHSIELEVVLLQYLYEQRRDVRIVPLLVGSFFDAVRARQSPAMRADIARMVRALQVAEQACGEEVCYIISGDLAHIGPKFNDPEPVHPVQLAASREQDNRIIEHAAAADANGYFDVIAEEGDARRICGLPPTWLTLAATRPSAGRLLKYDQYVETAEGFESVSFASMAFDR